VTWEAIDVQRAPIGALCTSSAWVGVRRVISPVSGSMISTVAWFCSAPARCILHRNKYTVVHMQTGTKIFRISTAIGVAVPIPWTASGQLLLDHMTREVVELFILPEDFILPSSKRIDKARFYSELCRASNDDYRITSGLVDDFAHCIAVPVRRVDGVA
jgi:DNA-binding IclR family transcriptional regulator